MDSIKPEGIENDRKITRDSDSEFLYEYQKAVLLALVERGRLTETQYRYAEERLRQQRYDYEKSRSAHSPNGA